MEEIKVGSYWRDKEQRDDIIQVYKIGTRIHWKGVTSRGIRMDWSGRYGITAFFERFESLNRLEVLVLFGEYQESEK